MSAKLSFKKGTKVRGLARASTLGGATEIKLARKSIGTIAPPHWSDKHSLWSVRIRVATEDGNFRWVTFAKKHPSEAEARAWFLANFETISRAHTLSPAP
jgi:hypothetical protein